MSYLLLVSFIWAFSFGLIKNRLAGLDPTAVGAVRIALSAIVFLPFLRLRHTTPPQRLKLTVIGALQFGVMYLLYQRTFLFLRAYEIALFTITTPLFVTWLDAILQRRFQRAHWAAALLSVAGAGVIVWKTASSPGLLTGFLLVQASNLCFAAGQLAYRRIRASMTGVPDFNVFGWLYLGALLSTSTASFLTQAWAHFSPSLLQWGVLAYLGVLSSALCFFWWNRGATLVNAGTLAAMNNAKVPLGVACSLLFFGEQADWRRLLIGGGLLAASLLVAERAAPTASTT